MADALSPIEVADVLVSACGHWGTGAEYLLNTVTALEAKGIHDSGLWAVAADVNVLEGQSYDAVTIAAVAPMMWRR